MGSIAVVTGPTGVIGTALVKKLVENNIKVYAVCRPHSHRISTVLKHYLKKIIIVAWEKLSSLMLLLAVMVLIK